MSLGRSLARSLVRSLPGALIRGGGRPSIRFARETLLESASIGALVGTLSVSGLPDGVTVTAYAITADPDSKFVLDGVDDSRVELEATLDYEAASSHPLTIEAALSAGDPLTRTFSIAVGNVLEVTLNDPLTISDTSAVPGEAWSATITGKTSGSTITATSSDGTVLAVVGTAVSGTFATAGSPNISLHETHPDAAPVTSVIGVTVAEVSSTAPDAYGDLQFTVIHTGISNQIKITVTGTPNLNGNTQTGMQYRVDGGTAYTTALVGSGDVVVTDAIELVDDVEVDVEIRVLTAEYTWGTEEGWSTAKPVTPQVVAAGLTYAFAGWINNDGVGGTTSTASLDLGTAAADRFVLACIMNNGYPALVSAPLGLPEIDDGDAWGRRGFYGNFVTTGSGSATMTVETATATDMWCPVFVIRGSTGLVVKDVQIGNPATVTVEAGDLVIAIQLHDSTEPWTNAPTEAAENTYAGVGGGFWKGYAAVFRATAPNAAFSPGVVSGRGERTALIVLGEP